VEIEFLDPAEAPLPPDQMSFRSIEVEPQPDGLRLKVALEIAPFQVRPSIDLTVTDAQGVQLASSSIIEATETRMTVTLHLRDSSSDGARVLRATLWYPDRAPIDERILKLDPSISGPPSAG
jgi:hypothetical protein